MTITFQTWIPLIINWIFMAVIIFIAYRGLTHIIKQAVKESMEEETHIFKQAIKESMEDAIKKIDERMKGLNALRNLRKID